MIRSLIPLSLRLLMDGTVAHRRYQTFLGKVNTLKSEGIRSALRADWLMMCPNGIISRVDLFRRSYEDNLKQRDSSRQ